MKIEYDFQEVSKFNESAMVCMCQIIVETVRPLGLLAEKTSEEFLMEFFHLTEKELDLEFDKLSAAKKTYIHHAYQLFVFLGRGYEMVTKRDQSYGSHLVRGIHKFFFQYAKRKHLITLAIDRDKYPNNRIMYVEKDYIKLLDYSSGIIPKEMIRTWMKIAKQYDFQMTQSATKLWFK